MPLDNFPALHETRRFNTEFTRALHLFLSWTRPIQSTSLHPTSPRSILIISTYLRLGLPSGLFPSGFRIRIPLLPIRATWPAHLILLYLIILIILDEEYKSGSSSLCNLFRGLYRLPKESVQVRVLCKLFVTNLVFTVQAGGPPLVVVGGCLFKANKNTSYS
jgi:hypothetical protein